VKSRSTKAGQFPGLRCVGRGGRKRRARPVGLRIWGGIVGGLAASSLVAAPLWFGFEAKWGAGRFAAGWWALSENVGRFAAILVASAVIHELLHAIGWTVAGRKPWRTIRFGFHWFSLSPYAHLTVPMAAGPYRVGVVLPGVVLGLIPAIVALVTGNGVWLAYGLTMILAAGADLVVLVLLLRVPGDRLVQDHPRRVGVVVLG